MYIAVSLSVMENRVQKGQSFHLTGITQQPLVKTVNFRVGAKQYRYPKVLCPQCKPSLFQQFLNPSSPKTEKPLMHGFPSCSDLYACLKYSSQSINKFVSAPHPSAFKLILSQASYQSLGRFLYGLVRKLLQLAPPKKYKKSEKHPTHSLYISLQFTENAREYTQEMLICMKASQRKQVRDSREVCIQVSASNLMKTPKLRKYLSMFRLQW